jgi:hypothetical protein
MTGMKAPPTIGILVKVNVTQANMPMKDTGIASCSAIPEPRCQTAFQKVTLTHWKVSIAFLSGHIRQQSGKDWSELERL